MKRIILLLVLGLATFLASPQSSYLPCGSDAQETPAYNQHEMLQYAKYIRNAQKSNFKSFHTGYSVPIKLWMVYNGAGNGLGTSSIVYQKLEEAVSMYYAQADIEFVICEEQAVFSDIYYDLDINTEYNDGILNDYYSPGFINMYIVNSVTSGGNLVAGVGQNIGYGRDCTVLGYQYLSPELIAHELGHCLHLIHTHGKYNSDSTDCNTSNNNTGLDDGVWCQGAVELDANLNIDKNDDQVPDCLQTGDDVCDTHAEPRLNISGMVSNCTYTGTVTDPNGDFYNPEIGNIMSYAPSGCDEFFTQGQYARMVYALENYGLQLFCESCQGFPSSVRTVTNLSNGGLGSLRWAIACANVSQDSVTILFDESLNNYNVIFLQNELPEIKGHITIEGGNSTFEKFILDGSGINDVFACGFTLNGDKITIRNMVVTDMPRMGLVSWNGGSNVRVENCEFQNSGQLFQDGMGIYLRNSDNIVINGCDILSTNSNGISILNSTEIIITNNTVDNNNYNALSFQYASQVKIKGNKIGLQSINNPFPNSYSGIRVGEGCYDFLIGGDQSFEENTIANQPYNAIAISNGAYDCEIRRNRTYCNEYGIYIQSGSNNDVSAPLITNITQTMITGTSSPDSKVYVYKTNEQCNTCEGYEFLGMVYLNGTSWSLDLQTPLKDGDRITATTTKNVNSSRFANCKIFECGQVTAAILPVSSTEICLGESAELFATCSGNCKWSTGETGNQITVGSEGWVYVTATNSAGCEAVDSVYITVNQLPEVEILANGPTGFCEGGNVTLTAFQGIQYLWSNGQTDQTITTATGGIYGVTITDANNCSNVATQLITVFDKPEAEIIALGPLVFCEGESTTLMASGGTDYTWNTGGTMASITVTTEGSYTVTATDANGCADTENVSVTVNQLPTVTLELGRDSFCINEPTIALTGGTPVGGNYGGTAVFINFFDPSAAGVGTHIITYYFEGINGCTNSDSQEVTVVDGGCTTGIRTLGVEKSIKVYPNPSSGKFAVVIDNWIGQISIELYDSQGRRIYSERKISNRIEIEGLPKGIYLLKISNQKHVVFKKLIVQ